MRYILSLSVMLLFVVSSSCNKSDGGVETSNIVGRWNLSSYMEDANKNRTNDDAKMPLLTYEFCNMNFTSDGKVTVQAQTEPNNSQMVTYDWSVSNDSRVMLHLTQNSPGGTNTYNIEIVALSFNTMVLLHDPYNTVPAIRYNPPHALNTNWLIFTRQQ